MDNLKIRRPEDTTKVNLHQQWEIDYWCNEFNCNESRLRIAVKAVGVSVSDVRLYLLTH